MGTKNYINDIDKNNTSVDNIVKVNKKRGVSKSLENKSNTNKELNNIEIESIVSNKVLEVLNKENLKLDTTQYNIACDIASGKTDSEIIQTYQITRLDLDNLYRNVNFLHELRTKSLELSVNIKEKRINSLNRIASLLLDDFIDNQSTILTEMSGRDKIKAIIDISKTLNDSEAKNNTNNLDITLYIKNQKIEENRLQTDKDGNLYAKSRFPTINSETGEIEN